MPLVLPADTRRRIARHIANLGSTDDNIASNAEYRLIRFGNKAVDAVLEVANDANPQVRFRAVWLLGKSRNPRAFPAIAALTEDPDERVRYDAVMALGELGNAEAIPLLKQLAQKDNDPAEVASAALSALAKLAPTQFTPSSGE